MSVNGWAFTFVCGFDPQSRSGDFQYDYDDYDAVRMRFIYVDLQGDNISRTITESEHAAVVVAVQDYLDKQSNHHLTLSDDWESFSCPATISVTRHARHKPGRRINPESYWYCDGSCLQAT